MIKKKIWESHKERVIKCLLIYSQDEPGDEFADQYFISSKNLFLKNFELLHLPHCN